MRLRNRNLAELLQEMIPELPNELPGPIAPSASRLSLRTLRSDLCALCVKSFVVLQRAEAVLTSPRLLDEPSVRISVPLCLRGKSSAFPARAASQTENC